MLKKRAAIGGPYTCPLSIEQEAAKYKPQTYRNMALLAKVKRASETMTNSEKNCTMRTGTSTLATCLRLEHPPTRSSPQGKIEQRVFSHLSLRCQRMASERQVTMTFSGFHRDKELASLRKENAELKMAIYNLRSELAKREQPQTPSSASHGFFVFEEECSLQKKGSDDLQCTSYAEDSQKIEQLLCSRMMHSSDRTVLEGELQMETSRLDNALTRLYDAEKHVTSAISSSNFLGSHLDMHLAWLESRNARMKRWHCDIDSMECEMRESEAKVDNLLQRIRMKAFRAGTTRMRRVHSDMASMETEMRESEAKVDNLIQRIRRRAARSSNARMRRWHSDISSMESEMRESEAKLDKILQRIGKRASRAGSSSK